MYGGIGNIPETEPSSIQVVITIHGTFANPIPDKQQANRSEYYTDDVPKYAETLRDLVDEPHPLDEGNAWWKLGSPCMKAIVAKMFGNGIFCRFPSRLFRWSGANREQDRQQAGLNLLEWMKRLEARRVPYHLIGHSHGGSVLWYALREASKQSLQLPNLKSWTTVGAPFLYYAVELERLWYAIPLVFCLASLGWNLISAGRLLSAWNRSGAILIPLCILILAVITVVSSFHIVVVSVASLRNWDDWVSDCRAMRWYGARGKFLWIEPDEALEGLRSVLLMKGKLLPRLSVWHRPRPRVGFVNQIAVLRILRAAVAPARIILGVLARATYNGVFVPLYNACLAPPSDEILWNRLKKVAFGSDLSGLRVYRVGRTPAESYWREELGDKLAANLVRSTNEAASELVARCRDRIRYMSQRGTNDVIADFGKDLLLGKDLFHTAYFDQNGLCDLLASHIVRQSRLSGESIELDIHTQDWGLPIWDWSSNPYRPDPDDERWSEEKELFFLGPEGIAHSTIWILRAIIAIVLAIAAAVLMGSGLWPH